MSKPDNLSDFNPHRKKEFAKDEKKENFLSDFNASLLSFEWENYDEHLAIEHPFLFVFGVPRSGTTLMAQLAAYSFDVGFINNFMAKFWEAPVTGVKLYQTSFSEKRDVNFGSQYAVTKDISDIHEFGYYWRKILKKESLDDTVHYKDREADIDWNRFRTSMTNIQSAFGKGMTFKSIFSSYHVNKISEVLEKTLFLWVKRDPLDAAVSILDARRKYYENLNLWWSYAPPEYDRLKDLDYMKQIAGQVYYLGKFYQQQYEANPENVIPINFEDLCKNPKAVRDLINERSKQLYQYNLPYTADIPEKFDFRVYTDRDEEKEIFDHLIKQFENA